jgi:hypothetical protein
VSFRGASSAFLVNPACAACSSVRMAMTALQALEAVGPSLSLASASASVFGENSGQWAATKSVQKTVVRLSLNSVMQPVSSSSLVCRSLSPLFCSRVSFCSLVVPT